MLNIYFPLCFLSQPNKTHKKFRYVALALLALSNTAISSSANAMDGDTLEAFSKMAVKPQSHLDPIALASVIEHPSALSHIQFSSSEYFRATHTLNEVLSREIRDARLWAIQRHVKERCLYFRGLGVPSPLFTYGNNLPEENYIVERTAEEAEGRALGRHLGNRYRYFSNIFNSAPLISISDDIRNLGPIELLSRNYPRTAILASDYPAEELLEAGFSEDELANAGYSDDEIFPSGHPLGFSFSKFFENAPEGSEKYNYFNNIFKTSVSDEVRNLGPIELLRRDYSRDAILEANYPADELLAAGFTIWELINARYTSVELGNAGCTSAELVDAISKEPWSYNLVGKLLEAGFTIGEYKIY